MIQLLAKRFPMWTDCLRQECWRYPYILQGRLLRDQGSQCWGSIVTVTRQHPENGWCHFVFLMAKRVNIDQFFFGLEKEAKRLFYRGKIEILKGYRKNVIQANEDMEIGIRKYRSAHGAYVNPWSGETRAAYDQIGGELNAMEGRIYQLGDELLVRINQEIRSLEGKVDDYR